MRHQGLTDRSRRPYRYANQLPFQVENFILNVKREHASWGARKIRERLIRRFSGIPIPAKSTIHAVLDRHGLVERRGRIRRRAQGTSLSLGHRPNELWCTEALDMKCPAEVYQPSTRPYTGLPDIDYPLHDKTIVVTRCGRICLGKKKSISARSSPAKPSASEKFTTTSGWSALWIMIWGTSIWRLECSNRSKIRSAQKCYPCSRYVL